MDGALAAFAALYLINGGILFRVTQRAKSQDAPRAGLYIMYGVSALTLALGLFLAALSITLH